MLKLTIKTPERRQWRRSGVFIVNFEHTSHLFLVLLLLLWTSECYLGTDFPYINFVSILTYFRPTSPSNSKQHTIPWHKLIMVHALEVTGSISLMLVKTY